MTHDAKIPVPPVEYSLYFARKEDGSFKFFGLTVWLISGLRPDK
jgi:hypothetical protein